MAEPLPVAWDELIRGCASQTPHDPTLHVRFRGRWRVEYIPVGYASPPEIKSVSIAVGIFDATKDRIEAKRLE
ncbi:MAG TPA: hypothetical protein VM182_07525 [Terriglobia bacterium]|nr:hypothetical protein [Terriglobia bacterium]